LREIFPAWLVLLLTLIASPFSAFAQAPSEPLALVRSFYAPGFNENAMPLSQRLTRLLDAAVANSRKHNAPVTGLDFAWTVNAQDTQPGYERSLQFGEIARSDSAALIRVAFHNGRDEDLRYELISENGKWVVDDIRYMRGEATTLSKMLKTGATEQP